MGPAMWQLDDCGVNPGRNLLANLLYSADSRHVRDVLVGGKLVVENHQFTTVNKRELLQQVATTVEAIQQRADGKKIADF